MKLVKMIHKIQEPQDTEWKRTIENYLEREDIGKTFKDSFYLAKSKPNETPFPDNTGLILVHTLLGDLEGKFSKEQKYVLFQTYHNYGDVSTIDVVKLPEEMHRSIVDKYLEGEIPKAFIAGGHVEADTDKIEFISSSGDYGNIFSRYDVNNIAAYLVSQSEQFKEVKSEDIAKGEEYINKVLDLMINHKSTPEFYSKLVDFYVVDCLREHKTISPHLLAPLVYMKASDRAINEEKPLVQTLVEETTGGIAKEITLKGAAERIKDKN